ncbi:MAG: tetratricopeptide repeat protein [Coleofasciculus sp. C1-SOL-03]|uniref:tetratricopeptide repeat protein n=1 Tax=Coleofasciculus sp. C1-SOL-03 TaxID=3069522 RepID=UPI0032F3BC5C
MADKKPKENPLKRILLVFSMVAFLGSTGYGLFGLYSNALQQPQTTATPEEASVDQQLAAKERGYELVLEREPENRVALEGLADIRLQRQDTQGAIAPLEKLIELHPQEAGYKVQLEQLQQQVGEVGEGEEESDR